MNKTVFITGTNSGFGKAIVELFAANGWNVAATVRNRGQQALRSEGQVIDLFP